MQYLTFIVSVSTDSAATQELSSSVKSVEVLPFVCFLKAVAPILNRADSESSSVFFFFNVHAMNSL